MARFGRSFPIRPFVSRFISRVDRYWVASTAQNWNDISNWSETSGGPSPAGVPGPQNNANFDGNGLGDCRINASIDVIDLTAVVGYTGHLDAALDDLNHTISGNVILDHTTHSMGDGTWEVNGNWDHQNVTTWNGNAATIKMTGTSTIITGAGNNSKFIATLWVTGTTTVTTANVSVNDVDVDGTLSIASGRDLYIRNGGVSLDINTGGTVNGDGRVLFTTPGSGGVTTLDGTFSAGDLLINVPASTTVMIAGTYDCNIKVFNNGTWKPSGSYTITGNLEVECQSALNLTYDGSSNPSFDVRGDFTINTTAGVLTWTKGTGTITFSGANNQNIDCEGKSVEDIVINKTAGLITMTGAVTTDSWTGTDTGTGTFDPNGQTITITGACDWAAAFDFNTGSDTLNGCTWDIAGNFTADGQTLNATAAWFLQVDGTAVASGSGAVAYSDASGFTEITATGWTDNNNNLNWDFGDGVLLSRLPLLGVG